MKPSLQREGFFMRISCCLAKMNKFAIVLVIFFVLFEQVSSRTGAFCALYFNHTKQTTNRCGGKRKEASL